MSLVLPATLDQTFPWIEYQIMTRHGYGSEKSLTYFVG
jgi:hypothetical protein